MEDCVFCNVAKKEKDFVYENDSFFSIPDISPVVKGHTLVISKKHFKNSLDLPNIYGSELLDCIKKTSIKLMEKHKAEGFHIVQNNFSAAQQEVNHVHFHILPRKGVDGLRLRLMQKDGDHVERTNKS